jgi:putative DNA primase/helicase
MQPHNAKTTDEAIGRWQGILSGLGVDPRFLVNKHGPCPVCNGKDRFRFDDKDGRGTWYCNQCGPGDGFELLKRLNGWSFQEAAKHVEQLIGTIQPGPVGKGQTQESKLSALRAVWSASRQVTKGDPVWRYLNGRLEVESIPPALRLHPSLHHSEGGTYPAMVAKMTYPDGTGASVHRTYLSADGAKAPVQTVKKFMAGKPLNTAAVRLSDVQEYIGIAEGIETALAASLRFQVPVWAATNAVLLESWLPPAGVKRVLIAGDNDASYTGQAAAFNLARRLIRDGLAVEIVIPKKVDTDWADK